jgi:uncharacterized protein (UPF0332 family)
MIGKNEILKHRIEKGEKFLTDAELLIQNESYLSAINRMYYSLFSFVTGYLFSADVIVKSHKGVKIKFHFEMTSKQIVTRDEGKLFDLLFMRRNESDYDDFAIVTQEEAEDMFRSTILLTTKLKNLIEEKFSI